MSDRVPKTGTELLPVFDAPPAADPLPPQPPQPVAHALPPAVPAYGMPPAAHWQPQAPAPAVPAAFTPYAQPLVPAQPYRDAHLHPHALECPECSRPTQSLKKYTYLSYLLFVWFFAFWSVKRALACPSCMRKDLLFRLALNLPLANVLWPFVILPWYSILFLLTFGSGHSSGVEAMARDRCQG